MSLTLFIQFGFSHNRRLEVFVLVVFFLLVIIVVGISRRHLVAYDSEETPVSRTSLSSVWTVDGLGLSGRSIARGNKIVLKLLLLCVGEHDGAAPRRYVVHCRVGGRPG